MDDDEAIRRLNNLFATVRRPDGRLWSDRAAAEALTNSGHPISRTQIGNIRRSLADPRFADMVALARLFGQPSTYFTESDPGGATDTVDPRGLSAERLAEKIELLFAANHGVESEPRSEDDVVAEINARSEGPFITAHELHQLRTIGTPVTTPHLAAIARVFHVDPVFFDPVRGGDIERDLSALIAMRDLKVRSIAARMCGLSDAHLDAVAQIVEQVVTALQDRPKP